MTRSRDVLDDGEVVGDEQHRQAEAVLQVGQQVDDLRLDRDVERRHGLVGDDELGLHRQRPGDDRAAAAARRRTRADSGRGSRPTARPARAGPPSGRLAIGGRADGVQRQRVAEHRADPSRAGSGWRRDPGRRSASACGSAASRRVRESKMSVPSKVDPAGRGVLEAQHQAADGGLARAAFARPVPRPRRGGIEKLTPSTALTWPTTRLSTPPRMGKCLIRPSTASRASLTRAPFGQRRARASGGSARRDRRRPPRAAGGAARRPRSHGAAIREPAAGRQVRQRRHLAGDGVEPLAAPGVAEPRDRRQEARRVGHPRARRRCRAHGPDSTTWPAYITSTASAISATTARSWVMNTMAMPSVRLQIGEQLQDLRLDGDVERRRRLVGDEQAGPAGQRHGDHHPLPHPARELVRIAVGAAGPARGCRPGPASRRRAREPARGRVRRDAVTTSAIWAPTVCTGFRLVIGSWKIMPICLPRTARMSSSASDVNSRPRRRIEPAVMRPAPAAAGA